MCKLLLFSQCTYLLNWKRKLGEISKFQSGDLVWEDRVGPIRKYSVYLGLVMGKTSEDEYACWCFKRTFGQNLQCTCTRQRDQRWNVCSRKGEKLVQDPFFNRVKYLNRASKYMNLKIVLSIVYYNSYKNASKHPLGECPKQLKFWKDQAAVENQQLVIRANEKDWISVELTVSDISFSWIFHLLSWHWSRTKGGLNHFNGSRCSSLSSLFSILHRKSSVFMPNGPKNTIILSLLCSLRSAEVQS